MAMLRIYVKFHVARIPLKQVSCLAVPIILAGAKWLLDLLFLLGGN